MPNFQDLCGWNTDEQVLADAIAAMPDYLKQDLLIVGDVPKDVSHVWLFEVVRKALGQDIINYAQEVGDCVSFGGKNGVAYDQAAQIAMGNLEEYHEIFPPFLWGCGRVFIGQDRLRGVDGSVGAWQAEAVVKFGSLRSDFPNVPKYSGAIARQWANGGRYRGATDILNKYTSEAVNHKIKTTAPVRTWEEAWAAISNYYTVTLASNVGFDMTPRSDGFHHYSTHWGHQMCLIGMHRGDGRIPAHVCILNSWGDVHGRVTDFENTSLVWPVGTLRVLKSDFEAILAANDSWAYSSFEGFPAQSLPEEFFSSF